MNDISHILKECSIQDIYYGTNGAITHYKIPIYQRNYAWERDEIHALIKDVYDSMVMDKPVYYIGTLVTFKRDDNVFEVIDGQQRLTTIYLILMAMDKEPKNKLTYSSRMTSTKTLGNLFKYVENKKNEDKTDLNFGEEFDAGIKNGYEAAKSGLQEIVVENKDKFKNYFLEKVHIIHYRVPKDVDLNHYFEVMNSRGEQLEKHEIVKAKLSDQLKDDNKAMEKFCQIWEACSDMSFYIQQKLPNMTDIFGGDMSDFIPTSFEGCHFKSTSTEETMTTKSIAELLNAPVKKENTRNDFDKNDSFQPIIDFPNFLLIVLKITRMQEKGFNPLDFTLDDKELISEFDKVELTPEFVKQFAYNLLLAKYYLDNYMIHHIKGEDRSTENPWKLQRYCKSENGKNVYMTDLINDNKSEKTDNKAKQRELIHLLSMFEVAFTAKQRKNYLFYCMLQLFENRDKNAYLAFTRKLADKYFFDVYLDASKINERNLPKPNSFDETIIRNGELNVELEGINRNFNDIFPKGTSNIPLFVFNYTDYKLWKKYADELRGNSTKKGSSIREDFFTALGCSDFGLDPFDDFYFSRTRKSLEHYYPQAKAGEGEPISTKDINCFGNFAMIGSDANSSGSDWNPIDKKNRYLDSKSNQVSVASLKFRIMLQICQDNYDEGVKTGNKREFGYEWNANDMQKHQEKMLNIIM